MDWFNRGNPICQPGTEALREELERFRRPVLESLDRLAARLPYLRIWDPFPLLCPDEVCRAVPQGRPLFYDADHITELGNRVVYADFRRFMEQTLSR